MLICGFTGKDSMHYSFKTIEACNMCGCSSREGAIVLGKRLNRPQGKAPHKRTGVTTTVVRCRRCRLVYSNPMPIPGDIQDHYGIPPEEYWKEAYFKEDMGYFEEQLTRLRGLLPIRQGARALDIGAGIGKSMLAMDRAGFEAFGIESSAPFYEKAIQKMGILPERLQLVSIEDAQFDEARFDFITFGAVLEHFYDPSSSIKKAMRWLRPGGIIHLEVPSSSWLICRLANLYYRLIGTDYVANISPMHSPFHLYEFDLRSFELNASENGYEIAGVDYFVCETFLPRWLDRCLVPVMRMTRTGMQMAVWIRKPDA